MEPDPIIDEIRAVRHRISEEYDHDPAKLIEHYRKLEREKYADRVVKPIGQPPVQQKEHECR